MIPGNLKLAEVLEHYARLLEVAGADRFRVRAYRVAARSVANADFDVIANARGNEDPRKLPGVGLRIAGLIRRYAEEGVLPGLEELERDYPPRFWNCSGCFGSIESESISSGRTWASIRSKTFDAQRSPID